MVSAACVNGELVPKGVNHDGDVGRLSERRAAS